MEVLVDEAFVRVVRGTSADWILVGPEATALRRLLDEMNSRTHTVFRGRTHLSQSHGFDTHTRSMVWFSWEPDLEPARELPTGPAGADDGSHWPVGLHTTGGGQTSRELSPTPTEICPNSPSPTRPHC